MAIEKVKELDLDKIEELKENDFVRTITEEGKSTSIPLASLGESITDLLRTQGTDGLKKGLLPPDFFVRGGSVAGLDFNDIRVGGIYYCDTLDTTTNSPSLGERSSGFLIVLSPLSKTMRLNQLFISQTYATVYMRIQWGGISWTPWTIINDYRKNVNTLTDKDSILALNANGERVKISLANLKALLK